MKIFNGFEKVQYGDFEYFEPNATPSEILAQMPKKLKRLIKKAGIREPGVWDVDMRSFTIIFKAADLVGEPAEGRATLAIKMNRLVPVYENQESQEEDCVCVLETDEREMAIREAVNTIQWVQEYIQAIGEEHKDAYVEGLEKAMKLLMGKKTMNFGGDDQPCTPPPRGEWRKFTDAHGNIIGTKNT